MALIRDLSFLPPYLKESPEELDQLPLQLSLITMEVAEHRMVLARLSDQLRTLAAKLPTAWAAELLAIAGAVEPPAMPDDLTALTEADDGTRGNCHD